MTDYRPLFATLVFVSVFLFVCVFVCLFVWSFFICLFSVNQIPAVQFFFCHRLLGDKSGFWVNAYSRLRAILKSSSVSFSDIRLWHCGGDSKMLKATQPRIYLFKSTMETNTKTMWNLFKVNNKYTRTTSTVNFEHMLYSVLVFPLITNHLKQVNAPYI